MRISTGYQYGSINRRIQDAQANVFLFQQQVVTGKRGDLMQVDPLGASISTRANSLKSATEQYNTNLRTAKDYMTFTESALTDTTSLLKEAYTTALQAANSTTEQSARNSMANQIATLQKRMVDIANTRGASGQYIFAGQKNDAQPFSDGAGSLTFNGDTNAIQIETGPGSSIAANLDASNLYVDAYQTLETLKNDLISGNISLISGTDVKAVQTSMNQFRDSLGITGSKLSNVENLKTQNARRIDELTVKISDIEDVDMSEAISNYQLAQTAYQAALQVSSTTSKLSLMDFIR